EVIIATRTAGEDKPIVEQRQFQPELGSSAVAVVPDDVPLIDPAHRAAQILIEMLAVIDVPGITRCPQIGQKGSAPEEREFVRVESRSTEKCSEEKEPTDREPA